MGMEDEERTEPAVDVEPAAAPAEPPQAEPTPAEPAARPRKPREPRELGIWTTVLSAVLVATAFLVFVAQNTDRVHVQWTVWSVDVPLAAVVFGAMLLGSVLTLLVAAIWRIGRRRRRREREELHRLRSERG